MSLGMMVTRLACMAHRLVSSNSDTRYDSLASCSALMAVPWKRLRTSLQTRERQRTADENTAMSQVSRASARDLEADNNHVVCVVAADGACCVQCVVWSLTGRS